MARITDSTILAQKPLLTAIEKVAGKLENCELTIDNYTDRLSPLEGDIALIAKDLSLNFDEAWIFAIYFQISINYKKVKPADVNRYLDCPATFLLRMEPIIQSLTERKLLRIFTKDDHWGDDDMATQIPVLYMPLSVIQGVTYGTALVTDQPIRDEFHFLEQVVQHARPIFLSIEAAKRDEEVEMLKDQALHIDYVRKVNALHLSTRDELLLHLLTYNTLLEDVQEVRYYIKKVETGLSNIATLKRELVNGAHPLVRKGLVRITGGEFFMENVLVLTDFGMKELVSFNMGNKAGFRPNYQVLQPIEPKAIDKVSLYYPDTVLAEVNTLRKYCSQTNYRRIQRRLQREKIAGGLTILLHGLPGTGKTELVKQIARQTGRVVMQVDMSSIKKKWVGESEKRVKLIFDEYKQACNYYDKHPILLFNEADGLISTRRSGAENGSGVRDMLNTMQNLLLQGLEDFEGILIATTNREVDFDPAFSRRFLYKVSVDSPDFNARLQIWKKRFPSISRASLSCLAELPLSGGQISNVARKAAVTCVLEGDKVSIALLLDLSKKELGHQEKDTVVGFRLTA